MARYMRAAKWYIYYLPDVLYTAQYSPFFKEIRRGEEAHREDDRVETGV